MLKVAVVRFPGSNCDVDALRAAERVGTNAFLVWHRDTSLQGADVVIRFGPAHDIESIEVRAPS